MRKQRQSFSREFKLEAVRLMEEGKKPPAELARELGLRRNQLYKWKEKRIYMVAVRFPDMGDELQAEQKRKRSAN